jgi:hypothetical protein
LKKSNNSAQHISSIDKTVRCDSFDKAINAEKGSLQSKDLHNSSRRSDDMEWNANVSSEEIDSLAANIA